MIAVQKQSILVGVQPAQYLQPSGTAIYDIAQNDKARVGGSFFQQAGKSQRGSVRVGQREPVGSGRAAVRQLSPRVPG